MPPALTLPDGRSLSLDEAPLLMGIVNVTPDSFSDGGLLGSAEAAVAHGLRLVAEGAAIVDLPELGGSRLIRDAGLPLFLLCSFEGH